MEKRLNFNTEVDDLTKIDEFFQKSSHCIEENTYISGIDHRRIDEN